MLSTGLCIQYLAQEYLCNKLMPWYFPLPDKIDYLGGMFPFLGGKCREACICGTGRHQSPGACDRLQSRVGLVSERELPAERVVSKGQACGGLGQQDAKLAFITPNCSVSVTTVTPDLEKDAGFSV